ncbi:MAG: 50S ribosomal protein L29 [Candidatus Sungiibacteriota bacterium]
MRAAELRQKSREDLKELLEEKKKRRDQLVESLREKKAKNVKELSGVKRDIARILTVTRESSKPPHHPERK